MNFLLYIVGFIVFIAGLARLAVTLGAPQQYIAIGVVILAGLGIMSAVIRTRRPEGDADTDVTVVKK